MMVRSGICWLAYLDLYGFSDETKRADPKEIAAKLSFIHERLLPASGGSNVTAFAFSDSIILCVDAEKDTNKSLDTIIQKTIELQNVAIAKRYVFRGSIAYGTMTFGPNICIGKPLLRAHAVEQNLPIPLVVLPASELVECLPNHGRPTAEIRTKTGITRVVPLLPRPKEPYLRVAGEKLDELLVSGPDKVALAWSDLISFVRNLAD